MQSIKPSVLLACVLLSVSAHGYLLSQAGFGSARKGPLPSSAVGVRMTSPAQEQPAALASESGEPAAEPLRMVAPAMSSLQLLHEPTLAAQQQELPKAGFASLEDEDEEGYIPRPRLTLAPVIQQPVLLAWPDMGGVDGQHSAKLSLFIDEEGVVRRVRIDTLGLPPAFEVQVRLAFMGARFYPGQLEGRDVKSRIRIEVSFDGEAQVQARGQRP